MTALWEPGDIIVSFRNKSGPATPQDSALGVWSSDGSVFRGLVHLEPLYPNDGQALQNLTYYNGYIYGRNNTQIGTGIWRSNGENGFAEEFFVTGTAQGGVASNSGGGIDIDNNGNVYVGDTTGSPDFGYQITKLDQQGNVLQIFPYNPANLPDSPDATCVRVTRDGSILYFAPCMSNYGSPVTGLSSLFINKMDLTTGALLQPIDFRYPKLQSTKWNHFNVDNLGRIWIAYNDFNLGESICVIDPDTQDIVSNFLTDETSVLNEALALNSDNSIILTHFNIAGAGPMVGYKSTAELFRFSLDPVLLSEYDQGGAQEEGFCFVSVVEDLLFPIVTLIGAN